MNIVSCSPQCVFYSWLQHHLEHIFKFVNGGDLLFSQNKQKPYPIPFDYL